VNIFVGNLACIVTDQDLRQLFELYGAVDTIDVVTDHETGRPCGFGFVDMPERSTARAAIAGLHGVHFEIPADDTGESREFWGGLFGWQFESYPGPFEYHMTRISDQGGLAITNMEPGKRGPRAYFDVDDIPAGAARVRERGG
jgi:hypothetical protein